MKTLAFLLSFFFVSLAAKPAVEVIMEKLMSNEHCAMKCHSGKMATHAGTPKKKCCGDRTDGCNPMRCCFGFCCSVPPGEPMRITAANGNVIDLFTGHSSEASTGFGPDCFQPPELA